jgi:hypothetical protein
LYGRIHTIGKCTSTQWIYICPHQYRTILVPVEMTFIDIVGFDGNDK